MIEIIIRPPFDWRAAPAFVFSSFFLPFVSEQQPGGVFDELDAELDAAQTLPVASGGEQIT